MTAVPNVFAGFIYGVKSGPFPYTISIRFQDDETIIFDDLLSMSSCHLNCIPTIAWIPDARALLKHPRAGLELITKLQKALVATMRDQFWNNAAWRSQFVRGEVSEAEIETGALALMGFNFPPSQFQLHVQCILPPLTPRHHSMLIQRTHFTHGRFFPMEYIRKVLSLNVPLAIEDADGDEIIKHGNDVGVSYDVYHTELLQRAEALQARLSNWRAEDFEFTLHEGNKVVRNATQETVELSAAEIDAVHKKDTLTLQSYGRPYDASGKPTGSYYAHAKGAQMPEFAEWANAKLAAI